MFWIVCDPSSGSVERAWQKLLVIFFLFVVGVWRHNFEPAVFVPEHTPQVQNYAAKHRLHMSHSLYRILHKLCANSVN